MPIPKPRDKETEREFITRCVSQLAKEDPDNSNKQRVAICFETWRKSKSGGEMYDTESAKDDASRMKLMNYVKPTKLVDYVSQIPTNEPYALSKKYKGIRATLHKKGNEVMILSESEQNLTSQYDKVVHDVMLMYDGDFILDGFLLDDKAHILDVIYFDRDVADVEWFKRQRILNKLRYSYNVRAIKPLVAKTEKEITQLAELLMSLPDCEGCIIHPYDSQYKLEKD